MKNNMNKNDIFNLISPNCVQLYLMLKFKVVKNPSFFSGEIRIFNSSFILKFNKENDTNFSYNEFDTVITRMVKEGFFKKFYKFKCENCAKITAIKEKEDNSVFSMVFFTGCSCKSCFESSILPNSKESLRELTYYTMSSEKISEDIFNLDENEELEKADEQQTEFPEERKWTPQKMMELLSKMKLQIIFVIITLIVWSLMFH